MSVLLTTLPYGWVEGQPEVCSSSGASTKLPVWTMVAKQRSRACVSRQQYAGIPGRDLPLHQAVFGVVGVLSIRARMVDVPEPFMCATARPELGPPGRASRRHTQDVISKVWAALSLNPAFSGLSYANWPMGFRLGRKSTPERLACGGSGLRRRGVSGFRS